MAKIESIDPHLHVLLVSYRSLFHADLVPHKLVGGAALCASLCPFEAGHGQACSFLVTINLSRQEILRMDGSIIEGANILQILPCPPDTTLRKECE